ncbi:hypothetical protein RD1_0590 [Roseobacter denitrificans OCh 114]|uniref:Uncharacterized protein n=1 Tax=Roseobacter denitrificans (strain ATCC 33942 / OCh 114) TaxID=375451 RepID=Q16CK2_ROSDO|nr:hypothetical protein RD1_0590 [Roseobacter denitrificans OCh 114]
MHSSCCQTRWVETITIRFLSAFQIVMVAVDIVEG